MQRDALHRIVDLIPEAEFGTAYQLLEPLTWAPAYRAARTAAQDDEPVTEADAATFARAKEEWKRGQMVSHAEMMKEFAAR